MANIEAGQFAAFKTAVYNWFSDQSGVTTIWLEESGPRPPRPYATLRLNTGMVKLGGQDNLRSSGSGYVLNGPRQITVACNIYGKGALAILTNVRDSLDDPSVIESLDAQGVSVSQDGNPQNVTEALESHFEQRAHMDVIFMVQEQRKASVGSITKVGLDGQDIGQ